MVVDSILPHAECGPNDHRKDAPPFSDSFDIIKITKFFYSDSRCALVHVFLFAKILTTTQRGRSVSQSKRLEEFNYQFGKLVETQGLEHTSKT